MELIRERERLEDEGKICVLGGSYNNGGTIGVQYEYKESIICTVCSFIIDI